MKKRLTHRCFSYLAYLTVFIVSGLAHATTPSMFLQGQTIIFSAGYRTDGKNIVEMGAVRRCNDTWCLQFARYDGAKNLPRVRTSYRHLMRTPSRSPVCINEYITTISPNESGEIEVKLQVEGDSLMVLTNALQYRWVPDQKVARAYVLSDIERIAQPGRLDQIVGFGFAADAPLVGSIKPEQIAAQFNGEIYHKNGHMGVVDEWQYKSSTIDFRRFTEAESDSVVMLTQSGHPDVIKRLRKSLWVHGSIILARSNDILAPLIHEYGHDFNMNGCFDEFGHNKIMLPVGEQDRRVRALVYIEYSPDKLDGVPMISVGRYYR